MRELIKYLLLIIFSVVFYDATGRSDISYMEETVSASPIEIVEADSYISSDTDSDLCLPRQISSPSPARAQLSLRRADNILKQSLEFVKSGKIFNPNIRFFIQKTRIQNHSSSVDSAHDLTFIGKLII